MNKLMMARQMAGQANMNPGMDAYSMPTRQKAMQGFQKFQQGVGDFVGGNLYDAKNKLFGYGAPLAEDVSGNKQQLISDNMRRQKVMAMRKALAQARKRSASSRFDALATSTQPSDLQTGQSLPSM